MIMMFMIKKNKTMMIMIKMIKTMMIKTMMIMTMMVIIMMIMIKMVISHLTVPCLFTERFILHPACDTFCQANNAIMK